MKTSLIISADMDLAQLAEQMGGYGGTRATEAEAYEMRRILFASAYRGLSTDDVSDNHWEHMLEMAVEAAA